MTCTHLHPRASPPPGAGIYDSSAGIIDSGAGIYDSGSGIYDSGAGIIDPGAGIIDTRAGIYDSGTEIHDSGAPIIDSGIRIWIRSISRDLSDIPEESSVQNTPQNSKNYIKKNKNSSQIESERLPGPSQGSLVPQVSPKTSIFDAFDAIVVSLLTLKSDRN